MENTGNYFRKEKPGREKSTKFLKIKGRKVLEKKN